MCNWDYLGYNSTRIESGVNKNIFFDNLYEEKEEEVEV